jgi:N-methylhydantoinase A
VAHDLGQLRIGVDVGGTFTDLVVSDEAGHLSTFKAPSTPEDPSRGVFDALERAATASGGSVRGLLAACQSFIHGTTVATNIMVQGDGARVGVLTTEGFRDVLAIRRGKRAFMWDYRSPHPPELVPRHLRLPIPERIDKHGNVTIPLDEERVREACRRLHQAQMAAVVVCFLNSFLNDSHEQRAEAIAREELPGAYICRSSDILPVMGEYERFSTAVVNAYVGPKTIGYLQRLEQELGAAGLQPKLLVMQSNGGIIDLVTCEQKPVLTVLSGPSAAAPAAQLFGECVGEQNTVLFDMGGTSCDVVLVKDGVPLHTDDFQVEGYDIALPAVDVATIGAGGGTIAWVDAGGLLHVGPRSAGAIPGPAAYGRGGAEPTVTDANLVLGRLSADNFLGGEVRLHEELARRAIAEEVAKPLGLSVHDAARAVVRLVNQNMIDAVKALSLERGHDPRRFVLVVGGGAGGLHAGALARELQIREVYLPRQAAVCCAVGMLQSDIRHDFMQGCFSRFAAEALTDAARLLADLRQTATAALASEGFSEQQIECRPALGLRYSGQQWQVPIAVPWPLRPDALAGLCDAFHARHEELYGSRDLGSHIELVDARLTAIGPTAKMELGQTEEPAQRRAPACATTRPVHFDGADGPAVGEVYQGAELRSGDVVTGPAIIEEPTTTLLVGFGEEALVDRYGNYRLVRTDQKKDQER